MSLPDELLDTADKNILPYFKIIKKKNTPVTNPSMNLNIIGRLNSKLSPPKAFAPSDKLSNLDIFLR